MFGNCSGHWVRTLDASFHILVRRIIPYTFLGFDCEEEEEEEGEKRGERHKI